MVGPSHAAINRKGSEMSLLHPVEHVLLVGIGATAILDLWLFLLMAMGVPTLRFALIGRWMGHLLRGRFVHPAIARSASIPGESILGWLGHYAMGIAFAALLVGTQGEAWLRQPTPGPALIFGLLTVTVPLLVLQPAMGAGLASSRTATPIRNVLRSVANHGVFGLGLYLSSLLAAQLPR